jgi:hypothetical protein
MARNVCKKIAKNVFENPFSSIGRITSILLFSLRGRTLASVKSDLRPLLCVCRSLVSTLRARYEFKFKQEY